SRLICNRADWILLCKCHSLIFGSAATLCFFPGKNIDFFFTRNRGTHIALNKEIKMKNLKIAASRACPDCFTTHREMVDLSATDYIDVAAVVLAVSDISHGAIDEIEATGFDIPVFIATHKEEIVPAEYLWRIHGVFECSDTSNDFYGRQLEAAALKYETQLRPPFFRALVDYVKQGNSAFDCPGHQGGQFF